MQLIQCFKEPTPKQFVIISFVYAIIAPVIGVLIAEPLISALMMLMLLGFAFLNLFYLKLSIPTKFSNAISGMPLLLIVFAFVNIADIAYVDLIEDKAQLQQITGIASDTIITTREGRDRVSSALTINEVRLRCDYQDFDDCARVERFKRNRVTVLYQQKTHVGNLVYEMRIGDQTIYDFDAQLSSYKFEKERQRSELFWLVVIFFLPTIWFYWQDRRIKNNKIKMSSQELKQLNSRLEIDGEMTIVIFVSIMISIVLTGVGAFFLAAHRFGIAAIYMAGFAITVGITFWLIKPVKK